MSFLRRAVLGLAALALAGCAALPTSGVVHEGANDVGEPGQIIPQGSLPVPGATPEEILRGFLAASPAGVNNAHQITREYLTLDARVSWEPWRGVTVYRADPRFEIVEATEGRVTYAVTMTVAATVDEEGHFVEASGLAEQSVEFELVEDREGQWRIDALPDAVFLNLANFNNLYRPVTLYFVSQDRRVLVPDVRWFAREGAASLAVQTLLETGPAPWLRDAVHTASLGSVRLEGDSVTVDATGTATVDLGIGFMDLPREEQSLVLAQLEAVLLRGVTGVSDVRFLVQGVPITVPPADDLVRDPAPEGDLVALDEEGRLVALTNAGLVPVPEVAELAEVEASHPAQGERGFPLVVLDAGRSVVAVRGTRVSEPWLEGRRLVAPSVDRAGWVWTSPQANRGSLLAARSVVEDVEVQAEWLDGREVRSLRVSRDGARLAVVSEGAEGLTVDVAAVVRDDLGRPQRLGQPHPVGAVLADASEVRWLDESTLAVIGAVHGAVTPTVAVVPVDGFTSSRGTPGVAATVSIAAGKGDRALYVATEDGGLWQWRAASWERVATGVREPAFPG